MTALLTARCLHLAALGVLFLLVRAVREGLRRYGSSADSEELAHEVRAISDCVAAHEGNQGRQAVSLEVAKEIRKAMSP